VKWAEMEFEWTSGPAVVSMALKKPKAGERRQTVGAALLGGGAALGVAIALAESPKWGWEILACCLACVAVGGFLVWSSRSAVVSESVLVLGSVGVQLTTERRGGAKSQSLVDASAIRAAIITEQVTLWGVYNTVCLVVDGLDAMAVLFPVSARLGNAHTVMPLVIAESGCSHPCCRVCLPRPVLCDPERGRHACHVSGLVQPAQKTDHGGGIPFRWWKSMIECYTGSHIDALSLPEGGWSRPAQAAAPTVP
jgi:hypothetical protein